MIEAIERLDSRDFSYILETHLPFCFHIEDVKRVLDEFVDDTKIELAMEWFSEDEWITYLEERYNLKFQERVEYVCYNPENGITKNKI
jgi:hypothetical protein